MAAELQTRFNAVVDAYKECKYFESVTNGWIDYSHIWFW